MNTTKTRTYALGLMLVAAAFLAIVGTASAHDCENYGSDHGGCDAHNCPDDGQTHRHWHDTPWNDWSQIDHGCTSSPTSTVALDAVQAEAKAAA